MTARGCDLGGAGSVVDGCVCAVFQTVIRTTLLLSGGGVSMLVESLRVAWNLGLYWTPGIQRWPGGERVLVLASLKTDCFFAGFADNGVDDGIKDDVVTGLFEGFMDIKV